MYVVNPSMLFSPPNLIVRGLFPGPYEMLIVVCHSIAICSNSKVSDSAPYLYKTDETNVKCTNLCAVWKIAKTKDTI